MDLIKKADLMYDYVWSTQYTHDDPKVTGAPDSTLLNRTEGWEVKYFINKFAEIHNLKNKFEGLKIEEMIKNQIPKNIHRQDEIKEWIENNW